MYHLHARYLLTQDVPLISQSPQDAQYCEGIGSYMMDVFQLTIFEVGEKSKAFMWAITAFNVSVMVMATSLYLHPIT